MSYKPILYNSGQKLTSNCQDWSVIPHRNKDGIVNEDATAIENPRRMYMYVLFLITVRTADVKGKMFGNYSQQININLKTDLVTSVGELLIQNIVRNGSL